MADSEDEKVLELEAQLLYEREVSERPEATSWINLMGSQRLFYVAQALSVREREASIAQKEALKANPHYMVLGSIQLTMDDGSTMMLPIQQCNDCLGLVMILGKDWHAENCFARNKVKRIKSDLSVDEVDTLAAMGISLGDDEKAERIGRGTYVIKPLENAAELLVTNNTIKGNPEANIPQNGGEGWFQPTLEQSVDKEDDLESDGTYVDGERIHDATSDLEAIVEENVKGKLKFETFTGEDGLDGYATFTSMDPENPYKVDLPIVGGLIQGRLPAIEGYPEVLVSSTIKDPSWNPEGEIERPEGEEDARLKWDAEHYHSPAKEPWTCAIGAIDRTQHSGDFVRVAGVPRCLTCGGMVSEPRDPVDVCLRLSVNRIDHKGPFEPYVFQGTSVICKNCGTKC